MPTLLQESPVKRSPAKRRPKRSRREEFSATGPTPNQDRGSFRSLHEPARPLGRRTAVDQRTATPARHPAALPQIPAHAQRPAGELKAFPVGNAAGGTRRSKLKEFFHPFSLERSCILFGFLVAGFLVLLFGLDLVLGGPFSYASTLFAIASVLCGLGLGYLSWDVLRDQLPGPRYRPT